MLFNRKWSPRGDKIHQEIPPNYESHLLYFLSQVSLKHTLRRHPLSTYYCHKIDENGTKAPLDTYKRVGKKVSAVQLCRTLQPHGLQPIRAPLSTEFSGKNTKRIKTAVKSLLSHEILRLEFSRHQFCFIQSLSITHICDI